METVIVLDAILFLDRVHEFILMVKIRHIVWEMTCRVISDVRLQNLVLLLIHIKEIFNMRLVAQASLPLIHTILLLFLPSSLENLLLLFAKLWHEKFNMSHLYLTNGLNHIDI